MKKRKKSSDITQVIKGLEKILKHGHYGKLPVQPVRKCPGHAGTIVPIHGESFILAPIKRISMGILARYVLVALIVRIPVHGTFDIL